MASRGGVGRVRKAVLPAAGFGTRFLPQTKAMPKEMLPVVDKPVIQYVVEDLVSAGIEDIIIVTGYHKRTIEDHFDSPPEDLIRNLKIGGEKKKHLLDLVYKISDMANFVYVRQKGPYGNGTPLLNVKNLIGDEPFIYAWSDDFIVAETSRFTQMIQTYEKYGCSVLTGIKATKDEDYDKYGFAGGEYIEDDVLDVKSIIEKPGKEKAPSDMGSISSFLFTPDIFDYLNDALNNLKEGDELYYVDALDLMLKDGKRILAKEIVGGRYYDTGNKLEYIKANVEFALKHPDINGEFREFLKDIAKDF